MNERVRGTGFRALIANRNSHSILTCSLTFRIKPEFEVSSSITRLDLLRLRKIPCKALYTWANKIPLIGASFEYIRVWSKYVRICASVNVTLFTHVWKEVTFHLLFLFCPTTDRPKNLVGTFQECQSVNCAGSVLSISTRRKVTTSLFIIILWLIFSPIGLISFSCYFLLLLLLFLTLQLTRAWKIRELLIFFGRYVRKLVI